MSKGLTSIIALSQQTLNDFKKHDDIITHASERTVEKVTQDNYGFSDSSVLSMRIDQLQNKKGKK